jgi:multidrug/hemolysin transport system permease protein
MVDEISGFYGTNEVGVLGQDVNLFWILLVSLLLSFLLLYFAYRNMSRKMTK